MEVTEFEMTNSTPSSNVLLLFKIPKKLLDEVVFSISNPYILTNSSHEANMTPSASYNPAALDSHPPPLPPIGKLVACSNRYLNLAVLFKILLDREGYSLGRVESALERRFAFASNTCKEVVLSKMLILSPP
jgi:hypothetical protein